VTAPVIPSLRPEPERDKWTGEYVLPDPHTGRLRTWTRATTVSHTLSDEKSIAKWQRRTTAAGLAQRPGLLQDAARLHEQITAAGDNWRAAKPLKKALDELCEEAADAAGANQGAGMGTALHSLTEWFDAGRLAEVEVPAELDADLRAYVEKLAAEEILRPVEYIERIVINTQVNAAGTLDRLVFMPWPCETCGKRLRVGDVKSQKTLDFGYLEIAIQLAEYAFADAMYDTDTRQLVPMPVDLCRCIGHVFHTPIGKARCDIHDIGLDAGWEAALDAAKARRWRERSKSLGRPYIARRPSTSVPSHEHLLHLVRSAGHPKALEALWRDAEPTGRWTDEHTQAAAARKAELPAVP
jgi:hypothetical protein